MKSAKQLLLIAAACASLGASGFAIAQDDNTATTTTATTSVAGQETTGQYVDNSALTVKVKAKLMADDVVKSLPITVTSYKGVVQLAGFVDDQQQIKQAIKVAKTVDGVKQVKDCLIVKH